jgi:tellurite methyltransferase
MHKVSWKKYIDKRKGSPPRALLLESLRYVPGRAIVLDLGAGAMNDARYLLSHGFNQVIAVDCDDAAEECAKEFTDDPRFTFIKSSFDSFKFPSEVDFINASYALPFNSPSTFQALVKNIKQSLKKSGVFSGQLFGKKDSWNVPGSDKTFLSRAEAEDLFKEMEILKFLEEEEDGKSALGEMKHFHVFHFIVRK